MPGVAENRRKWSEHNWEHEGHRWSPGGTRAGTTMMWWRSIRPRIHHWLPADTVLEIAPGVGRWTGYLLDECRRLIGVDVTERCVDVCRTRFADVPAASFLVNDGQSLPMVPDDSVHFAFSFDSLVHVEAAQIEQYLRELARTLKPGAAAFLHHSNLGAYVDPQEGSPPWYIRERHWRAESMSARRFRDACRDAGLICRSQELINWIGREAHVDRHRLPGAYVPLTDCMSVCVRSREPAPELTSVYVNRAFVDEWRQLTEMTPLYAGELMTAEAADATEDNAGAGGASGLRGALGRVKANLYGRTFAGLEPIVRTLRSGRCPDCFEKVRADEDGLACPSCRVRFDVR